MSWAQSFAVMIPSISGAGLIGWLYYCRVRFK